MPPALPPHSFYVISYPRSGNTWLINCLTMLVGAVRGEAYTAFKLYTEEHGDPGGFHFRCEPRQRPDQPIGIKSHDDLATFRTRHPPGPVIYIARDARDCLLSYYFFSQAYATGEQLGTQRIRSTDVLISRGQAEPVFHAGEFSAFLAREAPVWVAHVRSGRPAREVCFLTYESLLADFNGSLRRVVEFLQLPLVSTLEETSHVYHAGFGAVFTGNNRDFFRRGQMGDWKNWFTPAHAQQLDQQIGRDLLELGFETDPHWAARHVPPKAVSHP